MSSPNSLSLPLCVIEVMSVNLDGESCNVDFLFKDNKLKGFDILVDMMSVDDFSTIKRCLLNSDQWVINWMGEFSRSSFTKTQRICQACCEENPLEL